MPRISLPSFRLPQIRISRLILGISGSLLVVSISLVGVSGDEQPETTLPITAPNTVVVTDPPQTTSTTTSTTTSVVPEPTIVPPSAITPAPTPAPTVPVTSSPASTEAPLVPAAIDPNLPCQEWLDEALSVGWPNEPEVLTMLLRVMNRESRCTPSARSKSSDTGLLQLNDYWCEPSRYYQHPAGWLGHHGLITSCDDLFVPEVNLRSGLAIWFYSLERNGNGWHPWRFSGPTG